MERERFLSVVMPVFNERQTILEVIEKVLCLGFVKELIIVDDGSTDGTRELLSQTKSDKRVKLIFHQNNLGKGAALKSGFKEVSGGIVAIQDADLEYEPEELKALAAPILKGMADVVYGSRLSGGKPQRVYLFWHKVGNTFLSLLANLLYNTTLSDMETGYKVFKKEVIEAIDVKSRDFAVEPELTAKVFKKGCRVYEIPVSYYGRTYQEGKKITWKHGFGAIWALIKYRFVD